MQILKNTKLAKKVWVIEQLKNQKGYIIYQSYNSAYSNKAWLSTSTDGLLKSGDIMVFNKLKNKVNQLIIQLTGSKYNISTFENADVYQNLKPFAKYVNDYTEETAVNNFQRAWNQYGKGKIIPWAEFKVYIDSLAQMTTYFEANTATNTLFSEKVFNDWIDLFASPNPVHFPNLETNAITDMILPGRVYRFEIKVSLLGDESQCEYNYKIINGESNSGLHLSASLLPFMMVVKLMSIFML